MKYSGSGIGARPLDVSVIAAAVSNLNSTTTLLTSNQTFTGQVEDSLGYQCVDVSIATDRSGTLYIDYSSDGVNVDQREGYAVTPATGGVSEGFFFQLMTEARYYRLRYVNGGTNQGVFRLQSILNVHAGTGEVHAVNVPILSTTDAMTTKGVIYGLTTGGGGGYVAVKVTPSGALTTEVSGTVTANPSEYKTAVDVASASVTYVGKAAAGSATSSAVWSISKLEVTGNVTLKTSADGDFLFNNIWDNRASLSYS